jgi:hypothetical protein
MKEFWKEKALHWIEKVKARLSKLNGWMRLWFVASVIWVVATAVWWMTDDADYHLGSFPTWTMAEYELSATEHAYYQSLWGRLSLEDPWAAPIRIARGGWRFDGDRISRADLTANIAAEVDAALAARKHDKKGGYQTAKRVRTRWLFRAWRSRLKVPALMFLPPIGFLLLVKVGLFTIAWIGSGFRSSGNPTDD